MDSSSYPVESLHRRLATGLGNKGGARGSLTKCAVRLSGLKRSLEESNAERSGGDTKMDVVDNDKAETAKTNRPSIAEASDALARELQLARIELSKLYFIAQRQEEELEELKEVSNSKHDVSATSTTDPGTGAASSETSSTTTPTTAEAIAMERQLVHQLRKDLQQASSTVTAKTEYEQTAKLLCAKYPTSTAVLNEEIESLQASLHKANTEYSSAKAHMKFRQSQFRLLLQCMLDLKQSLTEPILDDAMLLLAHNTQQHADEDADEDDEIKNDNSKIADNKNDNNKISQASSEGGKKAGINTASTAMVMMEDDDEDEEGALYDDL
ncbi:hypothetical protein ACA910_021944 [Epithemia clementina (nom. ined.)]